MRDKAAILGMLGMNSPAAIYLNDQLSRENYEIIKEVMRLKRLKRLFWVFTQRGFVHVTQGVRAEVICVESIEASQSNSRAILRVLATQNKWVTYLPYK